MMHSLTFAIGFAAGATVALQLVLWMYQ